MAEVPQSKSRRCPVTRQTTDPEDLEHDFTTPGIQGNLECPFAKIATNGLPATPNSQMDPIAAEFHQDKVSERQPDKVSVVSPTQNSMQCPIRFLDQHSPEEVAQYFQKHKHEIPRSHEICVRRYQVNEDSIKKLDAKYGTLVNMIQGLGTKHKQYLPEGEEKIAGDHSSTRAVEKWAEDVSEKSEPAEQTPATLNNDEEQRMSHFERPLREVRVGESPTRPWGISVPVDHQPAASAAVSERDVDQSPAKSPSMKARSRVDGADKKCPFDHTKMRPPAKAKAVPSAQPERSSNPITERPQIVFNGPVFFGYSAEQAAIFLQGLSTAPAGQ